LPQTTEEQENMITLIYGSLLRENMPKGSSCASVEEKNVIVLTDSSLPSGNMLTGSSRAAN
jgi:hypothetical protein